MGRWQEFQGVNAGYVAELYERYRQDPASVDAATRRAFEQWTPPDVESAAVPRPFGSGDSAGLSAESASTVRAVIGAANLVEAIRRYGHLAAQLDPLGSAPIGDPSLAPESHGITEEDLRRLPASLVGGPVADGARSAFDAVERLRKVYSSTTGYDYAAIFVPEEREWLRHAAEAGLFRPPVDPIDAHKLLDRITQVEAFERFLHRTFPGKTRFSIEGLDMMVPILDEIIADAADAGTHHVVLGMAHRGRLNVLAHVLQKPYAQVLAEFKDPVTKRTAYRIDLGWAGDVKYHAGARVRVQGAAPWDLQISIAPNPSHLEAVNPVVAGMARASATRVDERGAPRFESGLTLPLLIHGDASFPGQGIVPETLNLSRLAGYTNGGTIHVIANNQLGFTATPEESYSTSYASGLARGFKIPIVHVNADDVEACIEAGRLAWAYRHRFRRDFLIDLVGYRRHGHNEGDEPAFTQPLLYKRVAAHPTVRQRWVGVMTERGLVDDHAAESMVQQRMKVLEDTLATLRPEEDLREPVPDFVPPGLARQATTQVPIDRLRALNESLLERPAGFSGHRKLERGRERRRGMFDSPTERTIDWATAEELALASILEDGIAIRLTGEDVKRGTFSHRHAAFRDVETGAEYVPLQHIPQARAAFEIHNSALTENATIGFEFGYNVQEPGRLIIWEAQYGDFINGAQIIIDEFVTSARAKWGQLPSLVFLLPHAYEGQGPDHSSARPERFLQAAADFNLRLANCTTAAQYFHLLRRQARLLRTDPLPLFVLTPKSLLRHPVTLSSPLELAEGRFYAVLDDATASASPADVERIVFCSGKVWADVAGDERSKTRPGIAFVRVEELYPFPESEIRQVLAKYKHAREVVWLQEEPANMGAWDFARPQLEAQLAGARPLRYVGRPRSAATSEGSAAWHAINQRVILDEAFDLTALSKGRREAAARK